MLAAYLWAQLEQADSIQRRRQEIWNYYQAHLHNWAERHGVVLPTVPSYVEQAYHMYYLLLPSRGLRSALIDHLKSRGILSVFHYLPLHLSDMGLRYGGQPGECRVAEDLADRLLRLPFYYSLSESEQCEVVHALFAFQDWE